MSTTNNESLNSYNYVCQKFGTVEMVRLRRNLFTLWDITFTWDKLYTRVSSGSSVEGLDKIESDVDIMCVLNYTVVCISKSDDKHVAEKYNINTLIIYTIRTKPCYALLRVPKHVPFPKDHLCFVCRGQDIFFSSQLLKPIPHEGMSFLGFRLKIHGPCLTTEDDKLDIAYSFRCKNWPSQARPWMSRPRISHWPSTQLVLKIVSSGVLFVPIGCTGLINEDIEWRISFSVADKLLIYSFNHTQLLCYGLMKLLLKDVIDKRESLKGLLCSYFLKTYSGCVRNPIKTCGNLEI